MSDRKRAEMDTYAKIRDLVMADATCARCRQRPARDPHHPYGRGSGKNLWRLLCFIPVCRRCHDEIHQYPNKARLDGWLVDTKQTP